MFIPFFDPAYLLFILPALILGLISTFLINYWTKKYSDEKIITNYIGTEVIHKVSQEFNLKLNISIVDKMLNSSYDPSSKTLNISNDIAHNSTISGTGILAHELGHAIQHQNGHSLSRIRSAIFPVVNIGTNIGYLLLIAGIILNFGALSWAGLIFFSLTTIYILITLPIEIDASFKANKLLTEMQICYTKEIPKIDKILFAAALTYLASLFQSLGQLLYFFFQIRGVSKVED